LAIGTQLAPACKPLETPGAPSRDRSAAVGEWIDALNADTEMVLVAIESGEEALARAVWARAAYLVELPTGSNTADALRALLQETLNRGRDAALVTTLESPPLSAETVQRMVAAYRAASDDIWAVIPETRSAEPKLRYPGDPMLLGRSMIEKFLRGQKLSTVDEILSANREHVYVLKLSDAVAASPGG
jgi:CTP:molybdopterin cytidylyltransferase MocA